MEPGEVRVALQQHHDGALVSPGDVKLYFVDGRLTHFAGDLHDLRTFPPRPSFDAESAKARLEGELGARLREEPVRFDVARQVFLQPFADAGGSGTVWLVDESSGEVVDTETRVHRNVERSMSMNGWEYSLSPPPAILGENESTGSTLSGPTTWAAHTQPVACSPVENGSCTAPSGECKYSLHRVPALHPLVYDHEASHGGSWTSLSPVAIGTGWDRFDLDVPLSGLTAGEHDVQLRRTAGPSYVYLDAAFMAPEDSLSCAHDWPVAP